MEYGKKVKAIIHKVMIDIQKRENECIRQMTYMDEHKFNMERVAIRNRLAAFNRCWHMVGRAFEEINKLEE